MSRLFGLLFGEFIGNGSRGRLPSMAAGCAYARIWRASSRAVARERRLVWRAFGRG